MSSIYIVLLSSFASGTPPSAAIFFTSLRKSPLAIHHHSRPAAMQLTKADLLQ